MNLAATVINDVYNDLQQGLHFYGNLIFHLNTLQKVVGDFALAREIEKSALLQELQAQKSYTNNFNNPKPFFQEGSMQFPQGKSVFEALPNQPPHQGPNQGHNQGPNQPTFNSTGFQPVPNQGFQQQQQQTGFMSFLFGIWD